MKALVYTGVESLTYRDEPDARAKEGEHLIRVEAVGICGSDMHAYLGHDERRPAPLILGHEAAGVIIDGPQTGRRVTINPLVTCQTCDACRAGRENLCPNRQIISMEPRPGAFAELVAMPDRNLVDVPESVSLEKASLVEPLAVSWHAARLALDALHPSMERDAVVLGGGAIGLAAALALKAQGACDVSIVEPNETRRLFLTDQCGQHAVETALSEAAIIIDAVGISATRRTASACARPGGVIAHVGLGDSDAGLNIRRITLQEITVIGTYTYTAQDFIDTAHALFDGRLGPCDWTEFRPLSEGGAAFADIRAGRVAAPKIVLKPELA